MGSENEPAKLLLPYLQRADELQKHELLVAYYCRLYAMERGLKIPPKDRTKTTNSLLVSLMNQLEKDKKAVKLGPEDNLYVEGFASNVFARADKQDRAGRADLNTAKTFYAASIFFEILTQFGDVQPELEQKQKYAVWKAADIRKALKEGRKPVPGPPGGDNNLSDPTASSGSGYDLDQSENVFASHQGTGADVPSQFNEKSNYQSSLNTSESPPSIPPASQSYEKDHYQSPGNTPVSPSTSPPQFHENGNYQSSAYTPASVPSYPGNMPPSSSYPNSDYYPDESSIHPPATDRRESSYSQPPHHQTFQPEPLQPPPQHYSSHEFPPAPYSYPNFQSYPSFNDQSLPAAPTHAPHYQGSDASYLQQSAPPASSYQPSIPYSSTGSSGARSEPAPPPAPTFQYDSNYEPPPEKIAEAHKAARFAVGALAFDDVAVAVDFLRKSLELLTNPSASQ